MSSITVNTNQFSSIVAESQKPVLVDFWAPWCGYCRRIAPALEQIAQQWADKLVVGKVNVDEQEALADRFGVETIPSLILFRNGEQAGEELVAPGSRDAIEEWLEENGVSL